MIQLEITAQGGIRMLHDDAVDLAEFGEIEVTRASRVEFDNARQLWYVASASTRKILGWFKTREGALAWEKSFYCPTGEGWTELTKREARGR